MNRRRFLFQGPAGLAGLGAVAGCRGLVAGAEERVDVLIVGGGMGGCAAAMAAADAGCSVILTEETDWLGGQVSSQGVPPDEHPWIEQFGCNASYREFREAVRRLYRREYPLTPAARANPRLNPGNGGVSALCHEPSVAARVLEGILAARVASGSLRIFKGHAPVLVHVDRDRIDAVTFAEWEGRRRTVAARMIIDATELGDVLALARVEHVFGAESQRETGEPHAPAEAAPGDQQSITWCFAVEYHRGQDHVGPAPSDYARWRSFAPKLTPPWPGPLLAWPHTAPTSLKTRVLPFDPTGTTEGANLWTYRRIRDSANFEPASGLVSVSLVNWPQNDYWVKPLLGVSPEAAAAAREEAKSLSKAFLHWLQTEAPRPDGGEGWRGLKPSTEAMGTPDGFAKRPYIRESRRLRAVFTVTENHIATSLRPKGGGRVARAEAFPDAVGIGAYRLDLHPTTGGRNYFDVSSCPFQIPFSALVPVRVENLLAGGKNLGVTHIANGSFRLHPVEWAVGEAAGAAAARCVIGRTIPQVIAKSGPVFEDLRRTLVRRGVELAWPDGVHPI
jgi:FAD dependent oxidoreductase